MSLGKDWKLPWENHSVQFLWQVFNAPNLTRFNAQGVGSSFAYLADAGAYAFRRLHQPADATARHAILPAL